MRQAIDGTPVVGPLDLRVRVGLHRPDHAPPGRASAQVGCGLPAAAAVWPVSGGRPRMRSAAFSASMIVGALMLPRTSTGITEASTTRSPSIPSPRSAPPPTAPHPHAPHQDRHHPGIGPPEPLDPQPPQLAGPHRPDRTRPDRVIEGMAMPLDEL